MAPDVRAAPTSEVGYATPYGSSFWSTAEDEQTPELRWPLSVWVYRRMAQQDAQTQSVLRAVTLPVRRTPWFVEQGDARPEVAQFVAANLGLDVKGDLEPLQVTRQRDRFSWPKHLTSALRCLQYGHAYFEQVYRIDDAGRAWIRKLAPRLPTTIAAVHVDPDGGLKSIEQYATADTRTLTIEIGVERLVAYVHEQEGGNWLGQSLLRSAYKHWLIKDRLLRVDAETIERNGMGVPIYEATPSGEDFDSGLKLAKGFRSGAESGGAIPNGAKLELRGVTGIIPSALASIRYHDDQIGRSVLAHFLNLGQQTGSWALGSAFADFFTMSLQTVADDIRDVAQQHIVEDLVDLNFGPDEPAPRLGFQEIGSRAAVTAEAIALLANAGVLLREPSLEQWVRDTYGIPDKTPLPGQPVQPPTPPNPDDGGA